MLVQLAFPTENLAQGARTIQTLQFFHVTPCKFTGFVACVLGGVSCLHKAFAPVELFTAAELFLSGMHARGISCACSFLHCSH